MFQCVCADVRTTNLVGFATPRYYFCVCVRSLCCPSTSVLLSGQHPGYWPPGYSLGDCSSCGAVDGDQCGECKLGCMLTFRPSMKPTPPPEPVPPTPTNPPTCGVFPSQQGASTCNVGGDLNFSNVFGNYAVLQMEPASDNSALPSTSCFG